MRKKSEIKRVASIAQEESRSISENVTWGQRKRFADGKVTMVFKHFLGYDKGEDGKPMINEKEAEVVRYIYRQFLLGKSITGICKDLTARNIKTPSGLDIWRESTVFSILRNEKYKGDALLQKKFTVDFLQKKMKKNEGEVPQYYVEGHHDPIISPDEFEIIQAEIKKRAELGKKYSAASIFSSKILCGDCGRFYGSKVWHSTDKYRKTVWQCNNKFKGTKCTTPHLDENVIKNAFIKACNLVLNNRDEVISNCNILLDILKDTSKIDKKIKRINKELQTISIEISDLINKNSTKPLSQSEFYKAYNALTQKYEKKDNLKSKLLSKKQDIKYRISEIKLYIKKLQNSDNVISEWDDMLWVLLIDKVTVFHNEKMTFLFKDGTEIEI